MCDDIGEILAKPCTQSEIDFYQSVMDRRLEFEIHEREELKKFAEFASLIPGFRGTLKLSDPADVDIAVGGVISDMGDVKEHIAATVAEQISRLLTERQPEDNVTWKPTRGKKIKTDMAVTLDNLTYGFKKANVLDVKLGVRLWADDAPLEKKRRFDKISSETTHGKLGFRIAGMRVYRGSQDASQLDEKGYKIYDKDYGRVSVNEANVVDAFRKFIFNRAAGISRDLGKAVCTVFARDLTRICEVMNKHESRMYSTSLLFVFEGDGEALRAAIEENNRMAERINSGIEQDHGQLQMLEERIYRLKLIDFAHAQWTPGLGPDENQLKGIRNLEGIFQQMAQ